MTKPSINQVAKEIKHLNDLGIILNRKTRRELAKQEIKNYKESQS